MPDATAAQIQEIEDLIKQARAVADQKSKEARELYQKAIELADKYFKLDRPPQAAGEPTFDPELTDVAGVTEGGMSFDGDAKAKIRLGPAAFVWDGAPSAIWLAAAKVHEYQHASNKKSVGLDAAEQAEGKKYGWTEAELKKMRICTSIYANGDEDELSAYDAMLKAAKKLGLSDEMHERIRKQKRTHYGLLPEDLQKKWRGKEPWLQFKFDNREFRLGVDELRVPESTRIRLPDGSASIVERATRLGVLVDQQYGGEHQRFIDCNGPILVDVSSLGLILVGPRPLGADPSDDERREVEPLLLTPEITANGTIAD